MGNTGNDEGHRYKVPRLVDEYDLGDIGEEMERLWTADGDQQASLRSLADRFNRRLLASATSEAGMQPLAGEVENLYRLLTDGDEPAVRRTETVRKLEREGVDVDALRNDFVSYQAIRTYLKNCLKDDYEREQRNQSLKELETIRTMRGRVESVVDSKIEQLTANHGLQVEDSQSIVEISVVCNECGGQYHVDELLRGGACDCYQDGD